MRYIGRLAPSPTGFLHLGHAATFLAAGDRAHAHNGHLLLRLDDLDPQRSKDVFVEAARQDLHWLGLTWTSEMRQSARLHRYREVMQTLVQREHVYPCTCSRKDLQQAIQAPHEDADDEPVYSGRCRPERPSGTNTTASALPEWNPHANYRFRVSDGDTISFNDANFGPQHFVAGTSFGDFLVWRKDGLPSYQLASVVDDADMAITEVVRGRDLLKSTARQIVLQRALELPTPAYFHTDLLRDDAGQRLAKRNDALSLQTLRNSGLTPGDIRARVAELAHHKA